MFLPAELVGYLDELRAIRRIQASRSICTVGGLTPADSASCPGPARSGHLGALGNADPEYQQLYRGYDEAVDWDPADPRLEEFADAMVRYLEQRYEEDVTLKWDLDDPTVVALLKSHFGNASSPTLERLNELTEQEAREPETAGRDIAARP